MSILKAEYRLFARHSFATRREKNACLKLPSILGLTVCVRLRFPIPQDFLEALKSKIRARRLVCRSAKILWDAFLPYLAKPRMEKNRLPQERISFPFIAKHRLLRNRKQKQKFLKPASKPLTSFRLSLRAARWDFSAAREWGRRCSFRSLSVMWRPITVATAFSQEWASVCVKVMNSTLK